MDTPVLANQQELTYINSGCSLEDLQGVMNNRNRRQERVRKLGAVSVT